jgi:hypothetical protein
VDRHNIPNRLKVTYYTKADAFYAWHCLDGERLKKRYLWIREYRLQKRPSAATSLGYASPEKVRIVHHYHRVPHGVDAGSKCVIPSDAELADMVSALVV